MNDAFKYDNDRDLLFFIIDICDTNADNVDWQEADPSQEFRFIADIINDHIKR